MVQALLDAKGGLWLTQAWVARYKVKLLENPEVTLQTCPSLNPATLLPETEKREHDCLDVIDAQYSSRPNLKDQPLPNAECEWYTDGSSAVVDGQRRAGYAVVTLHNTVEAEGLPAGTSAQLAELVALTRALEQSKGKRVNIFNDSKYAFGVVHAHAGLWKQRRLLTAQGSQVKHGYQTLRLLEAVQLLLEVAVVHGKAYQRENQDVAWGNARYTKYLQPFPLDAPVHSLQPSDSVLVCTWKDEPLQEKWKGPHTILLVSHTAAKVEGHKNWIHHSCLKAVPAPEQWTVQPAKTTSSNDLGLKLLFK
nr:uncharacterized protein LOC116833340 [Chelonoidis abingdonii]